MTSRVGARMGYLRAVTFVRRTGKRTASHARRMHSDDTKANWTSVRVAGLSKALRMDLEDVFVRAEDVYHARQRIYSHDNPSELFLFRFPLRQLKRDKHTMSFGERGALKASASSCAFWLTLPLRERIVRKASPRLFCRVCRDPRPPFAREEADH